ncbi:DUF1338 family protein [Altererythrobacter indicus]|uniref:2-oxoadipate dioxygenase/decarboxylase n=2 Tax=Altericroceibacterium indicum TaxID=374177 RepID=A0A845A857_9SPHN|nr:DUF1338 family protein [Altericroceibacterium indicum]
MSEMYRAEVPLYGDLISLVSEINQSVMDAFPDLKARLERSGEIARLGVERHGAIRVGTAQELSNLRRIFALMGMQPVAYYDLSIAGVPVHSTAFRPVERSDLNASPFRIFTSLLRLELIEDVALRDKAAAILAGRQIISDRGLELVEIAEEKNGLPLEHKDEFLQEVLNVFRWHPNAIVDHETYRNLHDAHRLIADVVSFKGPHINHLTPSTLDIDAAQEGMKQRGISAKSVIEGPPARKVPILLRQTSFTALEEVVCFTDDTGDAQGTHTARFGEIEQRGIALTPAGRTLYDQCLAEARGASGSTSEDYAERLQRAFAHFPDDMEILRKQGLAYFRYVPTAEGLNATQSDHKGTQGVDKLLEAGLIVAEPILYEDFLPVSAAGIFQSNLGGAEQRSYDAQASQDTFEAALGVPVLDPFVLYQQLQDESLAEVERLFSGG